LTRRLLLPPLSTHWRSSACRGSAGQVSQQYRTSQVHNGLGRSALIWPCTIDCFDG
jgi:hypothetical protein